MTVKSFSNILHTSDHALPMYQKIKEHILEKIAKGEWRVNQKLPSENEISAELNISRMTVNRAFKELTEEGYLFREKGAGTFVAEPFQLVPFFELIPISKELALEGNPYSVEILMLESVNTNQALKDLSFDGINEKSLFFSEMIYKNDEVPILYEKRYVLKSFAPSYLAQSFQRDCSTSYLQTLSPILSQKHTLEAIVPDTHLSQILQIPKNEACFKVIETLLIRNQMISQAAQFYPASRYKFHSKI